MTTTFENAKVGDRVFDYLFQDFGSVETVFANMILVRFSDGLSHNYFKNGTDSASHNVPRLFWGEVPPIVAPSKPVEVPPVDTLVRVWDFDKEKKAALRYSAGAIKNRKLLCWNNGTTSKTELGVQEWKHWEIVND